MYKILPVLFVTLLLAGCSSSNNTPGNTNTGSNTQGISGKVYDFVTGAVIPNATVTLFSTPPRTTKSTASGTFSIDSVPVGSYPVLATTSGYGSDSQYVQVSAGASVVISFRLIPKTTAATDSSLICLYRFSGNAVDSSVNRHDGSIHGATFVNDRFEKAASAIQFNGTYDVVIVPSTEDLNMQDSTDYTICFWAKPGSHEVGSGYVFTHRVQSGSNGGYELQAFSFTMSISLYGQHQALSIATDTLGSDKWRFVTVVLSGTTGYVTWWIDGVESIPQLTSWISEGHSSTAPLLIGNGFYGMLDDIRIFKKALSPSEISTLYHENGW